MTGDIATEIPGKHTHNAHNAGRSPAAGNFADSAYTFGLAEKLLCDLRKAGVNARPRSQGIELSGPVGALTPELLDRLRADRNELLALLVRSEQAVEDVEPGPDGARELAGSASGRKAAPPGALRCPWCGRADLRDDPEGLRCGRCERLAWVCEGGSMVRADCIDDDLEGLDPDDVPTCPSCGRWCDTETVVGVWHCSRCDAGADERRRRTRRVLEWTGATRFWLRRIANQ